LKDTLKGKPKEEGTPGTLIPKWRNKITPFGEKEANPIIREFWPQNNGFVF